MDATQTLTNIARTGTAPVVTEGSSSMVDQLRQRAQSQALQQDPNNIWDRLRDFGFALAASDSPWFGQAFGQAGQAMAAGERARRQEVAQAAQQASQEAQRDRQLSIEEDYRRRQMAVAEAELAMQKDPENPRNKLLLAQALFYARSGGAGGGGSGSGGNPYTIFPGEDGAMYTYNRRTNAIDIAKDSQGNPVTGHRNPERDAANRAHLDWQNRYSAMLTELARARAAGGPMATDQALQSALDFWRRNNPEPPRSPTVRGTAQSEPAAPTTPARPPIPLLDPRQR